MDQGVYDACVVGAGVMGSATGRHLAKLGKKTLLLDQFPLPHWRGSSHGQTRLIRSTYGEPYFCKMATDALKIWKEIEKEAGEKILHEKVGMLAMERQPGENNKLSKQHLKNNNVKYEEFSSKSLMEKFPDELCYGSDYSAILEKSCGVLMADKCLKNLQKQFVESGGALRDNQKVLVIKPDKDGVTIVTSQSSYRSRKVILTAGPWTNKLLKTLGIQLKLKPAQAPVCYWKITKPGCYDVSRFPAFFDASEGGQYFYGLPSLEYPGLIKMGPTGESQIKSKSVTPSVDPEMRDVNKEYLERFISGASAYIKEHFPSVDYTAPAIVEMCMYTLTPDHSFIIDKHPQHNNVIIATGFSGHGFKHAPVIGRILSDLALDQEPSYDISHFKVSTFLQQSPKSNL